MLNMAISIQRSMDGMPILISGDWIVLEGLTAPVEVRKDMKS